MKSSFLFFILSLLLSATFVGAEEQNSVIQVHLVPQDEATISSQIAERIVSIKVKDGDSFKKGDKLISYDCSMLKSHLRKVRAELSKARAVHKSNREMQDLQSISNLEVDISKADLEKAKAEVGIIAAQIKYCSIVAPFDGKVVKMHVHAFESVEAGTRLLEIVKAGAPELSFFVPSRWVTSIASGTKFQVKVLETGMEYPAEVTRLGGRIDPVSQTLIISGKFEQDFEGLLPGMSGEARFVDQKGAE